MTPAATASTQRALGASEGAARSLSGEKAQRIVEAMRRSVARHGAAGSTFDHVSREAGVSRENLYRSLSGQTKPEFDTILRVLAALGVQLAAKAKIA